MSAGECGFSPSRAPPAAGRIGIAVGGGGLVGARGIHKRVNGVEN